MKKRVLWLIVTVVTIASFALVPMASAQTLTADLTAAQAAIQQMVNTTLQAGQATNVATARTLAQSAVNSGQTAITQLQAALPLATDDATRSRINALITHLQAAVASGQAAVSGPDSDVAGKIDAMRGEAQEALNEFPPIGAPGTLPSAGGPGMDQVSSIAALGALVLLAGFGLRYVKVRA